MQKIITKLTKVSISVTQYHHLEQHFLRTSKKAPQKTSSQNVSKTSLKWTPEREHGNVKQPVRLTGRTDRIKSISENEPRIIARNGQLIFITESLLITRLYKKQKQVNSQIPLSLSTLTRDKKT